MSPIDVVLDRLAGYRVRPNGTDRWRACCPGHAGTNASALSIGVGAEGQVLLRCWSGCDVDTVVSGLGLELVDLFPPKHSHAGRPPRRRMVTAGQALELLHVEMMLVIVCASDLAQGQSLDELTRTRLLQAAARVSLLRAEAQA